MKHNEFNLKAYDNINLFGQSWLPEGETKAVINLIHGIGEHSTRYASMAEYYTQKGIAVYAIDYRGHGKSDGKRGHTPEYESLMKDIDKLMEYSANNNSCKNVFIYGHSLGGNLVINYVLRCKPNITGLIASSPWLRLAFEPSKFDVVIGGLVKNIYPAFTQKTKFELSDLSRNEENNDIYDKDDLVHGYITVNLFFGARAAAQWALDNASKMSVPFLLMHGSADKMTSPDASKEFALKSDKTELKIWEAFYHEIHNEKENKQVYNWAISWIEKEIKA